MARTLTDEDCDAVVELLLSRLAERIATPPVAPTAPATVLPPPVLPEPPSSRVERIAWSAEQTCELLGISRTSLWRLEKLGLLNPVQGLRTKLYSKTELDRFLAQKADPDGRRRKLHRHHRND